MIAAACADRLPRTSLAGWPAASALALLTFLSVLPCPALAQYQWLDERNQMVFSDRAPPVSIPRERILRVPETRPAVLKPAVGAKDPGTGPGGTTVAATAAAADPQASLADRDMAFRNRQLEQAEANRKAAEERGRKAQLASACNDARDSVRLLQSGTRISRLNASGEREYLSDAERRSRLDSARRNLSSHCG